MTGGAGRQVRVELSAVVLALRPEETGPEPVVLTPKLQDGQRDLPTASFDPDRHGTLQEALREQVGRQTDLSLGYVEQLYTFGDPTRSNAAPPDQPHTVSIGYLALTHAEEIGEGSDWTRWSDWFPWEDATPEAPSILAETILPGLAAWAARFAERRERVDLLFGLAGQPWRDELALERYELLYEADLVAETWRDRGAAPPNGLPLLGQPAPRDHRRILATGIGRLRGKLKYRPVLFELMDAAFTLFELQRAAEAVSGVALHKQNFRRMVEASGLLERTGTVSTRTGGRPAAEYRFAAEALAERRATAVRFGAARLRSG
ncbi:MAG: NAD regulator [Pseudomonadota bacterium]